MSPFSVRVLIVSFVFVLWGAVSTNTVALANDSPIVEETQPITTVGVATDWQFTLTNTTVFPVPSWSIVDGAIPPGMTLTRYPYPLRSTHISGTPTTAGTYYFRLRADNGLNGFAIEKPYTVIVDPVAPSPLPPLLIPLPVPVPSSTPITPPIILPPIVTPVLVLSVGTTSVPAGVSGQWYTTTLTASGGTSPYSWGMTAGDLPLGLTLDPTGVIYGTPSAAGSSSFSVKLTDAAGHTATQAYTMAVGAAPIPLPPGLPLPPVLPPSPTGASPSPVTITISPSVLANGTSDQWYGMNVTASGGTAPYSWGLSGGDLPNGLVLDPAGSVYGTAGTANTYSFTLKVTDAHANTARQSYTVMIAPAPVASPLPAPVAAPATAPIVTAPIPPLSSPTVTSSSTSPSAPSSPSTATTAPTPTPTPTFVTVPTTGSVSPGVSDRVQHLTTIGYTPEQLIKLPDDGNPDTQTDSAVYYIARDGRRHAFPNAHVYASWYADFSGVNIISPEKLATIPLGANMTYKPATRLVKFTTDPHVYVVTAGRVLRPIATEEVAATLYGTGWNHQVDDIVDTFYTDYTIGAAIATPGDIDLKGVLYSVTTASDVLP